MQELSKRREIRENEVSDVCTTSMDVVTNWRRWIKILPMLLSMAAIRHSNINLEREAAILNPSIIDYRPFAETPSCGLLPPCSFGSFRPSFSDTDPARTEAGKDGGCGTDPIPPSLSRGESRAAVAKSRKAKEDNSASAILHNRRTCTGAARRRVLERTPKKAGDDGKTKPGTRRTGRKSNRSDFHFLGGHANAKSQKRERGKLRRFGDDWSRRPLTVRGLFSLQTVDVDTIDFR